MKKISAVIFFFSLFLSLPGQHLTQPQLDSLFTLYSTAKKDTQQVWILSALSFAYNFKNPDSGLLLAKKELELSQSLNYKKGQTDAKRNLAIYWWSVGDYPLSIKLFSENLEYYREINDPAALAVQYGTMVSVYRDQGDFKQALETQHFSDSLNRIRYSCATCADSTMLGSVFYEMKQYDSALNYLKWIENNRSNWPWGNLMLGKAYAKFGNKQMALKYYLASVKMMIRETDMKDLTSSYNGLAELYMNKQMKDSALYYANRALDLAQEKKFHKELWQTYLILSDIHTVTDPMLAIKYLKLAFATKDSLYNQEKQRQISGYRFTEELNRQQVEATKKQYQSKLKTSILFAILGFFIIISIVLYRNNQHKQAANRKIETAYTRLQTTQALLIQSEKMASLGELTAGIAHEIQNPLNFVNNFSEVSNELIDEMNEDLTRGDIEEAKAIGREIKQNLEKINHHGKRADSIVKGMLQHSRSSSGQKELTDLSALCDEYSRLAYHGMRAKDKSFNVKFHTEFDDTIGKINIVSQDLGRVILNLINNAFYAVSEKATQKIAGYEPTVSVSTMKTDGRVELRVKDNGNGIPERVRDKIFQPFFTTKPAGQGTGLGLSLAYDIIKAHGGEIKVETNENAGSEFTIQLPM